MNHPGVSSTNHPSDETLAAFVDGRVDEQTRKILIEHIATCDDCRADWQTISDFAQEEAARSNVVRPNFRRGRWYSLSAVAAAIALGFVLWPFAETYRNRDVLMEASASRKDRPSLARLSGIEEHRPPVVTLRAGRPESAYNPDHAGVYKALDAIDRATTRRRSVENLRQYAAAQLLHDQYDAAVELIDEAMRLDTEAASVQAAIAKTDNAPLLNDLSAIYFARGSRRTGEEADFKIAGDAAHRAWLLSESREALWNYAVALEALQMKDEARKAWQDYVKLDPNSAWTEEAKGRLAELDAPSY